jgi:nucleotide-binding universal stress UspA family protein
MVVDTHRDLGSVGDYDICTAAKEIVGVAASEQATAIAFDEASRPGVYLVALLAWSDWTARGSPAIEWSTLQSVGGKLLAERLAERQERYLDVWVRRVVVPDRAASHLVMQSESAQLVVVGSHGRGGFAGMLLGSVSSAGCTPPGWP